MRALPLLAGASLALLLAAAACDDATKPPFLPEASPTATAEATPTAPATPTPTAAPEPGNMESFRAFAEQIEVALFNTDGSLFEDRAMISEQTCSGGEELGPCVDQPEGTVLKGVWKGLWRSDSAELSQPDEIGSNFESFVASAEAGKSDGFGAGTTVLYALASSGQGIFGGRDAYYAIVTGILPGAGGPERRIAVYQFTFDGERWRLYGVIEAGALYEEWLSAGCGDCYEQWELAPAIIR